MSIFSRDQPQKNHMTASAVRLDASQLLSEESFAKRIKDWQARTLRFSDMIPEVSSAGKFVENSIGRVSWEAFELDGNDYSPSENKVADELVSSLATLDAGRLARMLFVVGEAYIVVTPREIAEKHSDYLWWNPTGAEYFWRSVSIQELDVENGSYIVRPNAQARDKGQKIIAGQEIFRVWTPDQQYSQEPWSSHRSMLEILEAMVLHTIADKIFALSVVANAGILYIPNDDFLAEPYDNTGPPLPGTARAFDEEMNEAMRLALSNTSGSESISPLKMYGSAEYSKGLKHLLLDRQDNADAYAARMSAYRLRYATGVDLPAEVVTGIADSNHWSSWKVDQNTWTYHLAPMAHEIGNAIAEAWLIPKLQEANVANADKFKICPNGRNVVSKPDNTPTILKLLELKAIDIKSAMKALDMPEDWANLAFDEADPKKPEYEPQKEDTKDAPTRTDGDSAPEVKAASAAPKWEQEVVDIESTLFEAILEEMRRASTRAVTLSAKTADASQDRDAKALVQDTGLEGAVFNLLKNASADRMLAIAASPTEYMRAREAAMENASLYATEYVSDLLAGRLHRESAKNPDGSAVPSDYVPPVAAQEVMSIASGGDAAQWDNTMLRSTTPVQSWNADPLFIAALIATTGRSYRVEYSWERGHPRHPFPEHVVLQGVTWSEGEENPTLPYFPGDHHGCQCRIVARPTIS